jgi:predicted O-linked N-acetylglucosamine transferase (SPINDLY family)
MNGNGPTIPATQALQQAGAAYMRGDWARAEYLCRAVLSSHQGHSRALTLLGIIAAQTGRRDQAVDLLQLAVTANPRDAAAHCNRGVLLKDLERHPEALECQEIALKLQPRYPEAHYHRGAVLMALDRPEAALLSFERALAQKPDYTEAHNDRGLALLKLGHLAKALASFDAALEFNSRFVEAHGNRSVALRQMSRLDDALSACESALAIDPNRLDARGVQATLLRELGRLDEALACYDALATLKPQDADVHYGRGITLHTLKRYEDALACFERTLAIAPTQPWLHGLRLHTKRLLCDWRDSEAEIAALVAMIDAHRPVTLPFPVLTLIDSPAVQRRAAAIWIEQGPGAAAPMPPLVARSRSDRIRIGYYSADFHDHATAYLTAELFELHDRGRFELVAFSFGPDRRGPMRARLEAAFDRFEDVRSLSDRRIAELSRKLGIDIAVDLKGFTLDERHGIFVDRAAPLQVNYLGYPGTMGASHWDYLIADGTLIPEASREHYSEKIVYMPDSYQANDRRRPIAARSYSRVELGLPPTGFVFCCFNNHYKITAELFERWMSLLRRTEGSVLWLLTDNETAARNLRREAESRSVSGERLVFAGRLPLPEHLARHRAADLFLDTLPCNAHTTASDALWAGLPLLTCAGESFSARVAASLMQAIGLSELVAKNLEDYEALALQLASDPARLSEVRERLDRHRLTAPLFDSARYVAHLEHAYTMMYERHLSGMPAEDLHVSG